MNHAESLPELTYTSSSSGTTGDRLATVVHRPLLAERMAVTARAHPALSERLLGAEDRRVARLAAPNCSDVGCATPLSTLADRTLPDGTLVLSVAHDILATPPAMVDKILDELDAYRPAWLYADPTHLAFLCRAPRGDAGGRGAVHVGVRLARHRVRRRGAAPERGELPPRDPPGRRRRGRPRLVGRGRPGRWRGRGPVRARMPLVNSGA
ncbi:hypothetical protein ACGFYV_13075 [Streptomyces sp. NPDC048297]|uniref:hypothetical protein n=1 Tax=Streptomyces sp. NPDC048297 TaxID=3365531 RepID=UPI00371F378D